MILNVVAGSLMVLTHALLFWYFREPYKFTVIDPCIAVMMNEKLKLISEGYY